MKVLSPSDRPTFVDLLQRCCDEPGKHLDEQSCAHFDAYLLGYTSVAQLQATTCVAQAFEKRVEADFSTGNLTLHRFNHTAFLVAALGEPGALQRKLDYLKELHVPSKNLDEHTGCNDLFKLLAADGPLRKRPELYLGNAVSAPLFWSLLSGASWAERDLGIQEGRYGQFLAGFQPWMEQGYPFAQGIPWGRALLLVSLDWAEQSVRTFFTSFDNYLAQETEPVAE